MLGRDPFDVITVISINSVQQCQYTPPWRMRQGVVSIIFVGTKTLQAAVSGKRLLSRAGDLEAIARPRQQAVEQEPAIDPEGNAMIIGNVTDMRGGEQHEFLIGRQAAVHG